MPFIETLRLDFVFNYSFALTWQSSATHYRILLCTALSILYLLLILVVFCIQTENRVNMDNIEEKSFEYSSSNDYSSLNEEAPSTVDGKDKISGVVERVVFSNEENGYTVCEISSVSVKAVKFY